MKIEEIINNVKNYHRGILNGKKIDSKTTRDKVLYGNNHLNDNCTGIVTTCWATTNVIKKAHAFGANLIISHEALFWNHGDQQDWLQENENTSYLKKKKLLDDYGIVVWRDHDHIHSGIPMPEDNKRWVDGIFYGLAELLGWQDYMVCPDVTGDTGRGDFNMPVYFEIPETTTQKVAHHVIDTLNLTGCRIEGNPKTKVKKIMIPFHNLGDAKREITWSDKNHVDMIWTMEMIDFTLAEYVRDSSMLGLNKSILNIGHFNTEEAGMRYMIKWLPTAMKNNDLPIKFIQSGDMYHFIAES